MKVRLAKKILFGIDKSKNEYWTERVIRAAIDWKDDHRVIKALQIYHRKRRKEVKYE